MGKTQRTELVFILDKSGSMSGLERDTTGGFNSVLKQQKAQSGECVVTTVLFDTNYELLHDRIDIRAVSNAVCSLRSCGEVSAECFDEIREDMRQRGGRGGRSGHRRR